MGIELKNINKYYYYHKTNQNHALRDISLTINDGEMVAVTGKSGVGKSTLLHILGCIESYEGGSYIFNGNQVERLSDRKKSKIRNGDIGIVLQNLGLIEGYTVLENVMTPLHFSGIRSDAKKREIAIAALKRVGIEELKEQKVNRISGGQRQRVSLARALVRNPKLLILDDTLSAVDTHTEAQILKSLKTRLAGCTSVVVAHRLSAVRDADEILYISDGRITERGTHEELLEKNGDYARMYALQNREEENEHGK